MAKSKVTRTSSKDGADGGHENLDGANHDLNGRKVRGEEAGFSKNGAEAALHDHSQANGHSVHGSLAAVAETKGTSVTRAEKVKELIRLAQEQGYLTYGDINDALPDNMASPEEMEEIIIQLR